METLYKFYNSKNKFFTMSLLKDNSKADLFCEFLSLSNDGEVFHYKTLADNESSESLESFIPELPDDKDFDEIWEIDSNMFVNSNEYEESKVCTHCKKTYNRCSCNVA